MEIKLIVNGYTHTVTVAPDDYLSSVLRNLGYLSIRRGCDTGVCGACTIHLEGKAVLSCTTLAFRAHNKAITTIEGLAEKAAAIGKHLVAQGADQCGYCSTGLIMNILYLQSINPTPTDADIRHHLSGNLCRCTGYEGQLRAIKQYFEVTPHDNHW